MSEAAVTPAPVPAKGFHLQWKRWLVAALVLVVIGAAANLLGWDLRGWFSDLWDTVKGISLASLLGGAGV